MRIALYQPDIAQNTGTILRLAACLGVGVDIIRPAGFELGDRALRRAGLDYLDHATMTQHASWEEFRRWRLSCAPPPRLVLLSAGAKMTYTQFAFALDDVLLAGRESAGVPDPVRQAAEASVRIPLQPGLRSLNVAVAVAMVLGEGLRQTGAWPGEGRLGEAK